LCKRRITKISESFPTISHFGMNAYKTISKNDKNSVDETPNNQYNQGITELNNNEEDAVDKNSNLNFDISQN